MDMKIYYEKLADNIRIERARKKISQQRLAILSNVASDTISKIERQVANPTLETLVSIALALNVDLNTLLPLK